MQSLWVEETSKGCLHGCFLGSLHSSAESARAKSNSTAATSSRASRANFVTATTTSLFPGIQFTNHESLPTLPEAFSSFLATYPQYTETEQADSIREEEYYHLSDHICLDYTGFGLFSYDQVHSAVASSSSSSHPSFTLHFPAFSISYKSTSLKTQLQNGNKETHVESAVRRRITDFLNISAEDYQMVYTANRTSAFKLLGESYPFQNNKRLLTVYDYESEAVSAMVEISSKRNAKVMSAIFSWPGLRIQSSQLKKIIVSKKKKRRGLFVFPLQSSKTGVRYPYLWMTLAQESGWHVVLDACALGPKEMDTLGLSLFQPDFLICSFYKVYGDNPSGFACLFVKKTSSTILENSTATGSIGIVSINPEKTLPHLTSCNSGTDSDYQASKSQPLEDDDTTKSFSGPFTVYINNGSVPLSEGLGLKSSDYKQNQAKEIYEDETSDRPEQEVTGEKKREFSSEIIELQRSSVQPSVTKTIPEEAKRALEIECRCLDHADSLGLVSICNRLRYIVNWLVTALTKLQHPHSDKRHPLVRVYGPKVKFDRGPAVAFNVYDWKGEKIEPILVQKLADRSNISLTCSFLQNICFSDKYEGDKAIMEKRIGEVSLGTNKKKEKVDVGINVITVSFGFLARFEDAYKLWTFIAQFLDADFVEKERWRYMALNQKMVEV